MEFDVSYNLENAQQFWDELDDIVSTEYNCHASIDTSLRSYLKFVTNFKEEYLQSDQDIARCALKLLDSALFSANKDYVRQQIIYGLLQEDETATLHVITALLLLDGRANDETYRMMRIEGSFSRLVELLQARVAEEDAGLRRLLLELLYAMPRIQRLTWEDIMSVEDDFVLYLFHLVEQHSDDVNDPYHFSVIRVLLVLNEQYLVLSATLPAESLTNRVLKVLSVHRSTCKSFGENLIFLLNRESESSVQLLILKQLYMIFQNPTTAEFFYTNDLHVLLDVFLRNLVDLPSNSLTAKTIRHGYLRVLCPLLTYSQVRKPPHYKREEIYRLLKLLISDGLGQHFAPVDETTIRLVRRCLAVSWLQPEEECFPSVSNTGANGEAAIATKTAGHEELAKPALSKSLQAA